MRPGPPGLGDHGVAPADFGDHLEIRLQRQQRRQSAPDQRLIVGEQQPDRRAHGHGTRTRSAKPPAAERPTLTDPPAAAARSCNPARP